MRLIEIRLMPCHHAVDYEGCEPLGQSSSAAADGRRLRDGAGCVRVRGHRGDGVGHSAHPRRSPAGHTVNSAALHRAISGIPGYRGHQPARWRISGKYGSNWGTADWYHDTIYISPRVPAPYLPSVVRHEWSHELSVRAYGGDVAAAVRAMNRVFGGPGATGMRGAEYAADCMAIRLGATWTHYTSCRNPAWSRAAARLVRGHRI